MEKLLQKIGVYLKSGGFMKKLLMTLVLGAVYQAQMFAFVEETTTTTNVVQTTVQEQTARPQVASEQITANAQTANAQTSANAQSTNAQTVNAQTSANAQAVNTQTVNAQTELASGQKDVSIATRYTQDIPMSLKEAAWSLANTNTITGVFIGYVDEVSEPTFAIASIVYSDDSDAVIGTLKNIYAISKNPEGKCYALMGLFAIGDKASYRTLSADLKASGTLNVWFCGNSYEVAVDDFLAKFEQNPSAFVPSGFPIKKDLEAQTVPNPNASQSAVATSDTTTQTYTTTTTTTTVNTRYYPSFYWDFFPTAWMCAAYYRPIIIIERPIYRPCDPYFKPGCPVYEKGSKHNNPRPQGSGSVVRRNNPPSKNPSQNAGVGKDNPARQGGDSSANRQAQNRPPEKKASEKTPNTKMLNEKIVDERIANAKRANEKNFRELSSAQNQMKKQLSQNSSANSAQSKNGTASTLANSKTSANNFSSARASQRRVNFTRVPQRQANSSTQTLQKSASSNAAGFAKQPSSFGTRTASQAGRVSGANSVGAFSRNANSTSRQNFSSSSARSSATLSARTSAQNAPTRSATSTRASSFETRTPPQSSSQMRTTSVPSRPALSPSPRMNVGGASRPAMAPHGASMGGASRGASVPRGR